MRSASSATDVFDFFLKVLAGSVRLAEIRKDLRDIGFELVVDCHFAYLLVLAVILGCNLPAIDMHS